MYILNNFVIGSNGNNAINAKRCILMNELKYECIFCKHTNSNRYRCEKCGKRFLKVIPPAKKQTKLKFN